MGGTEKVLITFIIMVFGTIAVIAINTPSEHEKRMELIQEKEALLHLGTQVQIEETQMFIDSLTTKVDSSLK